jgi:undecaprenyl-diphosphatase
MRPWLAASWACTLTIAITFSVAAALRDRFPGDLRIAREVQAWPQPVGAFADPIRAITTTELVVVVGVLLAIGLAAMRRRREAITCALLFVALPLVQRVVKVLVDRPRPGDLLEMRGSATSPSFPSGHVMSGTVLFVALAALTWLCPMPASVRLACGALCAALAVAGGIANVYEGVHWPSDVLGGYLWAAVLLVPFAWALGTARGERASGTSRTSTRTQRKP